MRKLILAFSALCALAVCSPVFAQATTYTYTGNPYATLTNFTACEAGDCANFTGGTGISGTLQTSIPLAANLAATDISSQITGFSFSDGLVIYGRTDPKVRLLRANVTTDSAGAITALELTLNRWQSATPAGQCETLGACNVGPPLTINVQPYTNPNTKVDLLQIRSSLGAATGSHNLTCSTRGVAPSGEPDTCLGSAPSDSGASSAQSTLALPIAALVPAAAVPTMTEWAMILFGALLAGGAALYIQRRRFA